MTELNDAIHEKIEQKLNFKNWDEDENQIKEFLKKLEEDLKCSFLQTRLVEGVKEEEIQCRNGWVNMINQLLFLIQDEFELAVKEIINKEEQLRLALELSYILLEKIHEQREAFEQEINLYETQREDTLRDLDFKEQCIEEYQKRLSSLNENNEQLSLETAQLEQQNQQMREKNIELDNQLTHCLHLFEEMKCEKQQTEIQIMKETFQEIKGLKIKNQELTEEQVQFKEQARLQAIQSQDYFSTIDELKNQLLNIQREHESSKKKLHEMHMRESVIQNENVRLEDSVRKLLIMNERDNFKNMKLSVDNESQIISQKQTNSFASSQNEVIKNEKETLFQEIKNQQKLSVGINQEDLFNYMPSQTTSQFDEEDKSQRGNGLSKKISTYSNKLNQQIVGSLANFEDNLNNSSLIQDQTLENAILSTDYTPILQTQKGESKSHFYSNMNDQSIREEEENKEEEEMRVSQPLKQTSNFKEDNSNTLWELSNYFPTQQTKQSAQLGQHSFHSEPIFEEDQSFNKNGTKILHRKTIFMQNIKTYTKNYQKNQHKNMNNPQYSAIQGDISLQYSSVQSQLNTKMRMLSSQSLSFSSLNDELCPKIRQAIKPLEPILSDPSSNQPTPRDYRYQRSSDAKNGQQKCNLTYYGKSESAKQENITSPSREQYSHEYPVLNLDNVSVSKSMVTSLSHNSELIINQKSINSNNHKDNSIDKFRKIHMQTQLSQYSKQKSRNNSFYGGCKRDPYADFFMLTGQCIKLNSKYMDQIICIDIKPFYEEAKALNIPYHKWQQFLESKIDCSRLSIQMSDQNIKLFKVTFQENMEKSGVQLELCQIQKNIDSLFWYQEQTKKI